MKIIKDSVCDECGKECDVIVFREETGERLTGVCLLCIIVAKTKLFCEMNKELSGTGVSINDTEAPVDSVIQKWGK